MAIRGRRTLRGGLRANLTALRPILLDQQLRHRLRALRGVGVAFLQQREQLWTKEWVEAEARRRGTTAEEQLLAIFDLFDEWFRRDDFEGCSFINILLELNGENGEVRSASADHLASIRQILQTLAEEGGFREPDAFAHSWHILMKGSIVAAAEGDKDAARRAKVMGRLLIDQYR